MTDARPIRAHAAWLFFCHANAGYFLPWEDVPAALKDELELHGGIQCEGSGSVGPWCADCRFGSDEEGIDLS
jgi:hypothetical protein